MAELIFWLSFGGIFCFTIFYPLILIIKVYILKDIKPVNKKKFSIEYLPYISILIPARNAENFVKLKLDNSFKLNYPSEKLEIIFFSDGSTDSTLQIAQNYTKKNLKILYSNEHIGKIAALNKMVPEAKGDILIFTDVDALIDKNALLNIVSNFNDNEIGGVCGKRVILKKGKELEAAQQRYFNFAIWLQEMESKIGSVTANEGKIYAIRKNIYEPIANSVTDDLYECLSIIAKGYRFIFDSTVKAFVPLPSKSLSHEIRRRRRIVSTSLRGIFLNSKLLNPRKFGIYSFFLFSNKILRRFLPFFLCGILISNTFIYNKNGFYFISFIFQLIFYLFPIPVLISIPLPSKIKKISELITYFIVGNIGTFLGVLDFIFQKKLDKWEPEKSNI